MARPKPRRIENIPGIGKVYDFRGTGLMPPIRDSAGRVIRIRPRVYTEHIPVMRNQRGIEDFYDLADVLRARGLNLQHATDSSGNVCLYMPFNWLAYQARGANSYGPGCEHMHVSVGEDWTKRQLRASAYLWYLGKRSWDIPAVRGDLRPGSARGLTVIAKRGHVSHQEVSNAARYYDRSDPGAGYDWEYVRHCYLYYRRRHTFVGA
jgi:hypothetical protein